MYFAIFVYQYLSHITGLPQSSKKVLEMKNTTGQGKGREFLVVSMKLVKIGKQLGNGHDHDHRVEKEICISDRWVDDLVYYL